MSEMTEKDKKEKEKKNVKIIIGIVVIVVLLAVIVVLLIFLLRNKQQPEEERSSIRTITSADDAESIMEDMQEQVRKGMFECKMSMKWTFPDGKSSSTDAYVANSEANTYPIYFDVYINEDELIYSSPVIPVGSNIAGFALDKELPAGNYEATVMYTLVEDVETQKEISQAGFIVDITVQN
jgi:hypothetical protein